MRRRRWRQGQRVRLGKNSDDEATTTTTMTTKMGGAVYGWGGHVEKTQRRRKLHLGCHGDGDTATTTTMTKATGTRRNAETMRRRWTTLTIL